MTEPYAWLVAIAAALVGLCGVFALTRPIRSGFLKSWLRGIAAVTLLLPAPVPGFESYYAPAFLVALFEALLQKEGRPALAAGLLLSGIVVVTVLLAAYYYRRRRGATPKLSVEP